MHVVVATHGHCFDGLASAVAFTRLFRRHVSDSATFAYKACGYGPAPRPDDKALFTGDQNALLDYRYCPSDALGWYFDHHRTAFENEEARAHFDERSDSGRFFFDATYTSCTKLVADVARSKLRVDLELDELVRWADVVDSASFESADQAIARSDPVLQLVSVVERHGSSGFLDKLVPKLLDRPLTEVASDREVSKAFAPIRRKQERFIERVRTKGETRGRVVLVDLTDAVLDTVVKFVTYALYPRSIYSVVVALLDKGAKISVGYNPWSGSPLDRDISAICARHGGGGHAAVGAIPFPLDQLDRAREVARQIATELEG